MFLYTEETSGNFNVPGYAHCYSILSFLNTPIGPDPSKVLSNRFNNIGAIDLKMDWSALRGFFLSIHLIIQPTIEYFSHVWVGAYSCYVEFLGKVHKWICRTYSPSLESLVHHQNVASLSFFIDT